MTNRTDRPTTCTRPTNEVIPAYNRHSFVCGSMYTTTTSDSTKNSFCEQSFLLSALTLVDHLFAFRTLSMLLLSTLRLTCTCTRNKPLPRQSSECSLGDPSASKKNEERRGARRTIAATPQQRIDAASRRFGIV